MKVCAEMCDTCPFRKGSKYAQLAGYLASNSLTEASRICHSTGTNALESTGKPELLCRGARHVQLKFFCAIGFVEQATDEAWNNKCREMGLPAT